MVISRAQMQKEVSTGSKKMKKNLKKVDKKKNPGLAKLPTKVRNKMGYMKKGGTAMKKAKGYKKGGVATKKAKGYSKGGVAKKAKGMKRGGVRTKK